MHNFHLFVLCFCFTEASRGCCCQTMGPVTKKNVSLQMNAVEFLAFVTTVLMFVLTAGMDTHVVKMATAARSILSASLTIAASMGVVPMKVINKSAEGVLNVTMSCVNDI